MEAQGYNEAYAAVPASPSLEALPPMDGLDKHRDLFIKIMDTILVNCVRLNDALGRYGRQTKERMVTTNIEKVRGCVNQLAQLGYAEAIYAIKKENALFASKHIQVQYNETVYWEIIKKGAALLDPAKLPTSKGPLDEFTMAEKVATEAFMKEAGYGLSLANKRLCRILWKRLSEMRKVGVDRLLLYRTKEFDDFCRNYKPECEVSLEETVRSWEEKYGLHFEQLEDRITRESQGDFTGRLWLSQPHVVERLEVQDLSWNSADNPWFSDAEEAAFQSSGACGPAAAQLGGFFDIYTGAEGMRNKSIFVTLLPKDEIFLSVCPIISVNKGDFLGILAGDIRYSDNFSVSHGVPGPEDKLWLDYSKVTGTLNLMGVAVPGKSSNVYLQWELAHKQDGRESCLTWRVAVRALRAIRPFEELIRDAAHKEQRLLHQSPSFARKGFLQDDQF
ncbi:uncharacterized protein LDX57_009329 [Aspergillus melleus]|uniref:uncharacterized protein n=1 Tax=Aspergillus melleus TaxID=138277 RepID=UPI001E8EDDFB|nr:uncharacterized protein LDX57_009329 [Aspergillus melleus]KAH8431674.1 hypothetical protein LDX57_009329 [Aspergillus melleus]